jgi:hypothetical protein
MCDPAAGEVLTCLPAHVPEPGSGRRRVGRHPRRERGGDGYELAGATPTYLYW